MSQESTYRHFISRSIAFGLTMVAVTLAIVSSVTSYYSSRGFGDLLQSHEAMVERVQKLESTLESTIVSLASTQEAKATSTKPESVSHNSAGLHLPALAVSVSSESLEKELDKLANKMLPQFPDSWEAMNVVALMYAQTRRNEEARKLWKRCLELHPKNESFYVNLASLAIEEGDFEESLKMLELAKSKGLETTDINYHLVLTLPRLNRQEETIAIAKKELVNDPKQAQFLVPLAQALLESSQLKEANETFQQASDAGIRTAAVELGLGNTWMRLGNPEAAKPHLQRFQELKKDTVSGQERYQSLTAKDIQRTAESVFVDAAFLYSKQKNSIDAEYLLLRCLSINPGSVRTLRALAELYFSTKSFSEEKKVRERILSSGEAAFSDFVDLAKASAALGDLKYAEGILKYAATIFPYSIEPFSTLAEFYFQNQQFAESQRYASRAIEILPSPEGYRFLATVCKKLNDTKGEREATDKALLLETRLETRP